MFRTNYKPHCLKVWNYKFTFFCYLVIPSLWNLGPKIEFNSPWLSREISVIKFLRYKPAGIPSIFSLLLPPRKLYIITFENILAVRSITLYSTTLSPFSRHSLLLSYYCCKMASSQMEAIFYDWDLTKSKLKTLLRIVLFLFQT